MEDLKKPHSSDILTSNENLQKNDQDSHDSADLCPSSPTVCSMSNIIGTHPTEVINSVNPDNGYPVRQENGQRKTGPPPNWPTTRHPPGRGCEVFVGKLPRDCFESELFPLFERCGQIYEMRLMMDFSGFNRGYAFITYTCRDDAKRSVRELNNYEIRPTRSIGVCQSVDNCRLFVGGIPKTKKREEILEEMCKITEGVVDVIVYPSAHDKTKNRGFAFVEYESHRSAAMARRKLLPGKIQLWGHQIAVDWAEPETEVDEDVMATVRVLYVRNLMMNTNEEQIKEIFEQFKHNSVERVKKLKDYAFVHFRERDDALHAMNMINGREIDGSIVEVTLAKPVDKNQYFRFTRGVSPSTLTAALPFALSGNVSSNISHGPTTFDFTSHLTPLSYLTIPTTSTLASSSTVISTAANALQQKNVRRPSHLNGTLSTIDGSTSVSTSRTNSSTNPSFLVPTSTRTSQSNNNLVHHRGAYYTILRPASRRPDEKCLEDLYKETYNALYGSAASAIAPPIMMIDSNQPQLILPDQQTLQQQQQQSNQPDEIALLTSPSSIGFQSTVPMIPSNTFVSHPLLNTHVNGNIPYGQPSIVLTTTHVNNQSQQYFQGQSQGNLSFPFLIAPSIQSLTTPITTTATFQAAHPTNQDPSIFGYPNAMSSSMSNLSATNNAQTYSN